MNPVVLCTVVMECKQEDLAVLGLVSISVLGLVFVVWAIATARSKFSTWRENVKTKRRNKMM